MNEDKINSNESEGVFNEFIHDQLVDLISDIVNNGTLDRFGDKSSDIIVEMDDINPPTLVYDDAGGSGSGKGRGPGRDGGKIRFNLSFPYFMQLIAEKLNLPNLIKEGEGKIKQFSYTFKTFGPVGVMLDKKRTFKRALRTSVSTGTYNPALHKRTVLIRRRDKRYKLPQREEKPKYKAVIFFMGDISYSTYGERLEMEKRLVNFIQAWIDFNYGEGNVEHRFFVHDMEAYEVTASDFYNVNNAGGTEAACVFDLINRIAFNEYDIQSTNFYAFYFGDGELFGDDAKKIGEILDEKLKSLCNRIGLVEVKPSSLSQIKRELGERYSHDPVIRICDIHNKNHTMRVIKELFGERNEEYRFKS
ncbi:MAG: DUF444 family protein [Spirochaetales bacterium]|nr:DUF444 family protein [Spirochaetales bacterium]